MASWQPALTFNSGFREVMFVHVINHFLHVFMLHPLYKTNSIMLIYIFMQIDLHVQL